MVLWTLWFALETMRPDEAPCGAYISDEIRVTLQLLLEAEA